MIHPWHPFDDVRGVRRAGAILPIVAVATLRVWRAWWHPLTATGGACSRGVLDDAHPGAARGSARMIRNPARRWAWPDAVATLLPVRAAA